MPDEAPELLVLAEPARVGAHRGLDGQHVLAQGLGLGPVAEEGPGLVARKGSDMAVTLAQPPGRTASGPSLPPLMEKLVIEGGVPLSGTVVPAGNKNAALPLLAAASSPTRRSCSTTSRGSATRRRCSTCSRDLGVRVECRDGNTVALQADERHARPTSTPTLAERIRASFLVAGPLLARFGAALMPPPGRRRDRPPPARPAPRRLPRARRHGRARPRHPHHAPDGGLQAVRLLHGRAVRDGHRERADGGGADARHDGHPQRRLRAARPGPRAHAHHDGRRDRGHRLQRHARARRSPSSAAASTRVSPDHIEIALVHGAGRRDRRRAADQGLRPRRPADDPAGLPAPRPAAPSSTATTSSCPAARSSSSQRDAGDYQSKVEDGPWPAFPADLTSIARRARHPVRGLRADLREDVREPPVLRRQAGRDGRGHHPSATRTARSSSARAGCAASGSSSPDIRAGMAMLIAALCAEGDERDRQRPPDRPRLRADRRAAARRSARASSARSRSVRRGR